MNKLSRRSFFATLILLIGGCAAQIHAQRCGGDVRYIVREESGAITALTDPTNLSIKFVRVNGGDYTAKHFRDSGSSGFVSDSEPIRIIRIQTGCGHLSAEVGLELAGKLMLLRFRNLPGELNFFVDSLPFQEGTFEIDFKDDMGLKHLELNWEGVKDKDGKLWLHGTAQSRGLVSVNNWKRVTTQ